MSSRSLNKVLLIGNLTRDPELRYTPQGTPVCTFGLATNRSWQPTNGERQEETEFHRIVAWNKLAELCSELLFKGRKVYVEGRLQTRNWTDAQGQERTTVEIVIENMIVLDSKRKEGGATGDYEEAEYKEESGPAEAAPAAEEAGTKETKPSIKKKAPAKKAAPAPSEDVNPDDIPF
jgi:single-strand DNA-binding protein